MSNLTIILNIHLVFFNLTELDQMKSKRLDVY